MSPTDCRISVFQLGILVSPPRSFFFILFLSLNLFSDFSVHRACILKEILIVSNQCFRCRSSYQIMYSALTVRLRVTVNTAVGREYLSLSLSRPLSSFLSLEGLINEADTDLGLCQIFVGKFVHQAMVLL